jgi:hypothetical protein
LHDGKSYRQIQEMSLPPENLDDGGNVSEEMYIELCEDLQRENGELESMELIESLPRNDSNFTLWKAKYSKNQHYVFWAFGIDSSQLKVREILVQW